MIGAGSLEPIIERVRNAMKENIGSQITDQIQSENLSELSGYYEKAKISNGNAISKVANDLVGHIMSNLPQRFVQLAVENIQIEMEGKKPNVKFDVNYEIESIKPYVEFIIKASGVFVKSERARFEFNASGAFKDLQINTGDSKQKTLSLGALESNFSLLLTSLPFVKMEESKELYSKDISVDLSGISI
jgi:hypothetical protein